MNREIEIHAKRIHQMLINLPVVHELKNYEKALIESKLLDQEQVLFEMQKALVQSLHDQSYENKRAAYFKKRNDLQNHPLIVNYQYCYDEVTRLIYQIKEIIEKNL